MNLVFYHSLNVNIWLPKLFITGATVEPWKSANTICNNDGGSLMSVITQDDKSAFAHYSNAYPSNNIWVGLKKIEATSCINDQCDRKLRWLDGNQFVYDSLMHGTVTADTSLQDHTCFRGNMPNKQYIQDDCEGPSRPFLCRIELCSGNLS